MEHKIQDTNSVMKLKNDSWEQDYIPGLVSIIVPVYNIEKYVQRAIDSAISQDYKKIEVILVDDGSTDSSGHICDAAANQDSRVRVIHQSNTGLGGARNTGIAAAKGEYFSFLDGDDWIDSSMISKMTSTLTKHEGDIVMCNRYYVTVDGIVPSNKIQIEEVLSKFEGIKEILAEKKLRYLPAIKFIKGKFLGTYSILSTGILKIAALLIKHF